LDKVNSEYSLVIENFGFLQTDMKTLE